jgi:hypothetical protein
MDQATLTAHGRSDQAFAADLSKNRERSLCGHARTQIMLVSGGWRGILPASLFDQSTYWTVRQFRMLLALGYRCRSRLSKYDNFLLCFRIHGSLHNRFFWTQSLCFPRVIFCSRPRDC